MRRDLTEVQGEHFAETFLRSINIRYDALHPERIAHFHPTTKSVDFLKALAGFDNEKAFIIVAPYGTGKSLAATYLLHLIENCPRSKETLAEIGNKLNSISPDLSSFSKNRNEDKRKHGVVIALNGYCRSLGDSLKEAAIESMERINLGREATPVQKMSSQNIDQALNVIKEVKKKAHAAKNIDCDRIIILWDEFGRHIESSLDEGRSSALLEIQTLAEYVSRSKDLPMTLGLFLHRGLLHYAGNMPQTMEWEIPSEFQPKPENFSFDLDRTLGAVLAFAIPQVLLDHCADHAGKVGRQIRRALVGGSCVHRGGGGVLVERALLLAVLGLQPEVALEVAEDAT